MSDTMRSVHDTAQGLIPLVIGVTGHRDLREEDRNELEGQVRSVFEEIKKDYPHTPILLLSPLAEGADRLVAQVALEPEFKARFIAPLPMPRAPYERDFQTPASRAEFNGLLQRTESWFELPLVEGNTEENIREYGKHRDLQYETVGKFIVRHSQILIALWDGEPSELVGGTAQIVQYWLEDFPQQIGSLLNPPDPVKCGPVYHIVTPRVKNPNPDKARTCQKRFPEGYVSDEETEKGYTNDKKAEKIYHEIHKNIENFNQDALNLESELVATRETSKEYLLPRPEAEDLPDDLKFIRECYATADTLALYFQRKTLETLWALCLFAFMAVFFFEIYAHVLVHEIQIFTPRETRIFLSLYSIFLIVAFFCYYLAKRNDYQNKYQDYRALAEGLRVQFFWRLSGLPTSVEEHYLGKQRRELDWIRSAIRTCWSITRGEITNSISPGTVMQHAYQMQLVLKRWIEGQYSYFNKAGLRDQKQMKLFEQGRNLLLLSSVGVTLLTALVLLFSPNLNDWLEQHKRIQGLLLIVIVNLPTVIAASNFMKQERNYLLLWSVGMAFLTVLVLLFGSNLNDWLLEEYREWRHGLLLVMILSLPAVIAALLYTYAEKKALSSQIKQYGAMKDLFEKAKGRLRKLVCSKEYDVTKYKESQALVEELGKEALVENGDWVLMHRERPLELEIP